MKKLELNQMENLEGGRRFWGTEKGEEFCDSTNCTWSYPTTYYVLGIPVSNDVVSTGANCCSVFF
ncbi:MAG: hypothetical protein ACOVMG_01665 [Flavobacterium sp.]